MPKPIFVAATRQHTGKTTVSLALMKGLKRRFERVGFIKPVGQQHIPVKNEAGEEIRVDTDVQVMKEYFALHHLNYADMSPVIIPRGYTSRYIDGDKSMYEAQVEAIQGAFQRVEDSSETVLVEGTGHVGVGSIVELSNARAAKLVGAEVVLVANGGLGKAFDELEMNRQLFAQEGVPIAGVVLNKVMPDKVDMIREKMGKVLMERWGVPLLGAVTDLPVLGRASLHELQKVLGAKLISGEKFSSLDYNLTDAFLVTTGLRRFLNRAFQSNARKVWKRPLFVTHSTRDDLVLGFLAHHQKMMSKQGGQFDGEDDWAGAMVVSTGTSAAWPDVDADHADEPEALLPYLKEMAAHTDAPILVTNLGTMDSLTQIKGHTGKHNIHAIARLEAAIEHYEPQINLDALLQ